MGCPSTQVYHKQGAYMHEIWACFAVGSVVLFARAGVRLRAVGWRGLQGDDYMAIAVWLCFICDSVAVTVVYRYGSNLDYTEAQARKLSDCQIDRVRIGSQMQLLAWYTYTALIWSLKAMMLFFFNRLTLGLYQQRLVKIFAGIAAVSYLAVWLTITCGCHPIHLNWQMLPYPPERSCQEKLQNFYVTTVLNVLTDALILVIPVPLLWGMRVSLGRKIALTVLLCSGIFVIIAAILRITFTMKGVNALNINLWGTRETAAGIIAVNVPILRALLRPSFWRHDFLSSNRASGPQVQRKEPLGEKGTIGTATQRQQHADQLEHFERQLRSWTTETGLTITSMHQHDLEKGPPSDESSASTLPADQVPPARRNAICTENLGWSLELGFPCPDVTTRDMDDAYRVGPRPLLPEPEPLPIEPQPVILPGPVAPPLYRERVWDIMPPIAEVISHDSGIERQHSL